MSEFINIIFAPANLFYTIILIAILVYWVFVIMGAMDLDALDIDLDLDIDADVDVDVDVDSDVEANGGFFLNTLAFFNFGRVPFMIVMTVLVTFMWLFSILTNYYIGGNDLVFAAAIFIPNLFICLFITKFLTTPLANFHKTLDTKGVEAVQYEGLTGTLRGNYNNGRTTQATVLFDDNPLLINVKLYDIKTTIPANTEIIIIRKDEEENFYWAELK